MWKAVLLVIRLLLPTAAIILLVLAMKGQGARGNLLLGGGLLCATLGLWLNIYLQRKARSK